MTFLKDNDYREIDAEVERDRSKHLATFNSVPAAKVLGPTPKRVGDGVSGTKPT